MSTRSGSEETDISADYDYVAVEEEGRDYDEVVEHYLYSTKLKPHVLPFQEPSQEPTQTAPCTSIPAPHTPSLVMPCISQEARFDPIDPDLIGCMNWKVINNIAPRPWQQGILAQAQHKESPHGELLSVIPPVSAIISEKMPSVRCSPAVSSRWDQLPENLFAEPPQQYNPLNDYSPIAECGLHPVPKTEVKLRLVFDCRQANALYKNLPTGSATFFTLDEFMRALDFIVWHPDAVSISGDLRHFYYQIPLAKPFRRLFMVQSPDGKVVPTVCPMGFFPVSTWAQTVTWSALLATEPMDKMLGVVEPDIKEKMPSILWLYKDHINTPVEKAGAASSSRERVGFIAVLMDGFNVFCTDKLLAAQWRVRIHRNFKHATMIWKHSPLSDEQKESANEFEDFMTSQLKNPTIRRKLLGHHHQKRTHQQYDEAHYEKSGLVINTHSTTFNGLLITFGKGWVPDSDLAPWFEELDSSLPFHVLPRRKWASLLGELLWHIRVRRSSLLDYSAVMDVYSFIHQQDLKWDESLTLSNSQVNTLKKAYDDYKIKKVAPREYHQKPNLWLFVLSDAYTRGRGWIVYTLNSEGELIPVVEQSFDNLMEQKQVHQEAGAAADGIHQAVTWAIEKLQFQPHCQKLAIVLGVDAESVRIPFAKGYSKSPTIREFIREFRAVTPPDFDLFVTRVPGVDNISDYPSRGRYVYLAPCAQRFSELEGVDIQHRKTRSESLLLAAYAKYLASYF